jgi:hypothetical protein
MPSWTQRPGVVTWSLTGRCRPASGGPTGVGLLAGDEPGLEVLGDTHCGSGQTRAALRAGSHLQTIKPIPLQSTVPGGFTVHDFQIDQQAGTAKCPAGYTAPITSSCRASFARHCQHCPLRGRCTTAKRDRTIQVHPTRTGCAPPGAARPPRSFQQSYRRWRPMVERSIAWLVADGCRRVPYRGSNATTCGCRCASPLPTCAVCWCLALPTKMAPGCWPETAVTRAQPGPTRAPCQSATSAATTVATVLTGPGIFSRVLDGQRGLSRVPQLCSCSQLHERRWPWRGP